MIAGGVGPINNSCHIEEVNSFQMFLRVILAASTSQEFKSKSHAERELELLQKRPQLTLVSLHQQQCGNVVFFESMPLKYFEIHARSLT